MRRIAITLLLAASCQVSLADTFLLIAKPGNFKAHPIGKHASSNEIEGTISFRSLYSDPSWPPAAYMGMHEGQDRNNSVQTVVIRNKPTDDLLIVGYRVIINGKEAEVAAITSLNANDKAHIKMHFKDGRTTIQVNELSPIIVLTPFSNVATYVSTSSAEAIFDLAP